MRVCCQACALLSPEKLACSGGGPRKECRVDPVKKSRSGGSTQIPTRTMGGMSVETAIASLPTNEKKRPTRTNAKKRESITFHAHHHLAATRPLERTHSNKAKNTQKQQHHPVFDRQHSSITHSKHNNCEGLQKHMFKSEECARRRVLRQCTMVRTEEVMGGVCCASSAV